MKRIRPGTLEEYVPALDKNGFYTVADPRHGGEKHHKKNQIKVSTYSDLCDHVRRGNHVRMRGLVTGQTNLIRPEEISF